MIKNIDISGLKPEQIEQIKAIIEAFKAKNELNNIHSQFDMIEHLLENPLQVENLEFRRSARWIDYR